MTSTDPRWTVAFLRKHCVVPAGSRGHQAIENHSEGVYTCFLQPAQLCEHRHVSRKGCLTLLEIIAKGRLRVRITRLMERQSWMAAALT